MSDPVAELAAELADMKRRLHALETAPRATKTSVSGGYTRWLPPEGEHPGIYIGGGGGTDVGISGYDVDGNQWLGAGAFNGRGRFHVAGPIPSSSSQTIDVVDGQFFAPLFATAWQTDTNVNIDTQGRPTVTSSTFTTLWRTVIPCTTKSLNSWVVVYPGVGQNAECRINAQVFGQTASVQLALETGITSTAAIIGPWVIPAGIMDDGTSSPIGHLMEVEIDLRRTSGANPVAVAPQWPVIAWPS